MNISQDIRRRHGGELGGTPSTEAVEIEAGMAEKSREFAASGHRVYLPLAD
ncbi:thiamine biosynthesis protein ThiC [Streptomyces sp. NPDC087658]|uniref:thiamine biosynthesis protein ThiC n=1 Tax=Streptomyces sp. NPDC087658 TaxID=3365800 RepID=UPI00382D0838